MAWSTRILGFVAVAALTASAGAQSINFSVQTTTPPSNTPPSFGYHAAAAGDPFVADAWVTHTGTSGVNPIPLGGGVTLTPSASVGSLNSTTNNIGAGSPDDQRLLAGIWDLGGTASPQRSFTFNGLQNGIYDVYTYAMAPDSSAFRTRVNVNADAGAGDPGVQVVGGAYTGAFQLGVTHALHTGIVVNNGMLVVNTTTAVSFGSLAGIQLVLIPGPGGLALLGLAGLVRPRRRRS